MQWWDPVYSSLRSLYPGLPVIQQRGVYQQPSHLVPDSINSFTVSRAPPPVKLLRAKVLNLLQTPSATFSLQGPSSVLKHLVGRSLGSVPVVSSDLRVTEGSASAGTRVRCHPSASGSLWHLFHAHQEPQTNV